MNHIKKNLANVRFLLTDKAFNILGQLKACFPEEPEKEIFKQIFTEPATTNNEIIYVFAYDGEIIPFSDITDKLEKATYEEILISQTNKLLEKIKIYQHQELETLLKKCLTVPDKNNEVYVVKCKDFEYVAITYWGFEKNLSELKTGELQMTIFAPKVKLIIETKYEDDDFAAEVPVTVYQTKQNIHRLITDSEGKTYIEKVRVGSYLKTETEGGLPTPTLEWTCNEAGYIPLKVKRIFGDFDIRVVHKNDNSKTVSGIELQIQYENKTEKFVSDENGKVFLRKVRIENPINISETQNPSNSYQFRWEKKIFYVLVEYSDMIFVVKHRNGEIAVGAKFVFEYNNKREILESNSEGKIYLKNLRKNTSVKYFHEEEGVKINENIIVFDSDREYIIFAKRNSNNILIDASKLTLEELKEDKLIMVTTPHYDNIGLVLNSMNVQYKPYHSNLNCFMAFLNCGTSDNLDSEGIKKFVEKGGVVYGSDLILGFYQQTFPNIFIPGNTNENGKIKTLVVDEGLKRFTGEKVEIDLSGTVARMDSCNGTILLKSQKTGKPIMALGTYGAGKIFYTCFHNSTQASRKEKMMLEMLIVKQIAALTGKTFEDICRSLGVQYNLIDNVFDFFGNIFGGKKKNPHEEDK